MRRLVRATGRSGQIAALALVVGYAVLAVVLWRGKDFSENGVLAFEQPEASSAQLSALGTSAARLEQQCFRGESRSGNEVKIVTAVIKERRLFACYDVQNGDQVKGVEVVDADGFKVRNPKLLKPAGVWPHYAVIKSGNEFVVGGLGVVVLFGLGFLAATRRRLDPPPPNAPWWGRPLGLGLLAASIVGWAIIPFLSKVSRARKARYLLWGVVGWAAIFGVTTFGNATGKHDQWGVAVISYLGLAGLAGAVLGARARSRLGVDAPAAPAAPSAASVRPDAARPAPAAPPASDLVRVERPESLPTFRAVGGMDALKRELRETIGLMLAFTEHADAYRITWNGVLLHGRPGTGKTFMAEATAGEFGLNLIKVSTGDLVSAFRGESARNVEAVFRTARQNLPVLLFFDEFDSVATRRDDNPDQEARRTVNQLLQSLEEARARRELVVMAATNDLGSLDPAVIRPGRFDRHIFVPFPDRAARAAILAAQLERRPGAESVDVDELAGRTEGMTPAALAQLVSAAALQALRDSASSPSGQPVPLTTERLVDALKAQGGRDRPTVEDWGWDRLILPAAVKAELQEIAVLAADPDAGRRFGVQPPSGALLYGPPGTGKSTIARVLAAEADCSFYAVSASDLTSKWLGESERLIAQLFDRARDNRPSIVFIDEVDAIAGARGGYGTYDRQVNELLQQIDGVESMPGVLVVAATNRKDKLDPALLRGGRLSRHIEIPLPDVEGRRALLALFTAAMPVRAVDLGELATRTAGLAGADIEALCQEAGMQALLRDKAASDPAVTADDFARALAARGLPSPPPPPDRHADRPEREGYI